MREEVRGSPLRSPAVLLRLYKSIFGWVMQRVKGGERRRWRMGYLEVAHTMEQAFGTGRRRRILHHRVRRGRRGGIGELILFWLFSGLRRWTFRRAGT